MSRFWYRHFIQGPCARLEKVQLLVQCPAAATTGVEVPTDEMEFAEIVNPASEPSNSNVTKDNFRIVKLLGSGAYGRVFLGKLNGGPDKYYAIKKLNKKKVIKKKQLEHTKTESRVLFFCKHPFLVSMAFAFQTKKNIYFVMDYCIGGDLYFHLRDSKSKFDEARVRFYVAEIAQALGFLHSNKVVHRDLKPENVLLDEEGHIKIADFGLCKENVDHENTTSTYCGTVQYIAPEVLQIDDYGCAVDWWALGVIVYEMVYRRLPFFDTDTAKLCKLITSDTPKFPDIDSTTKDFLTRLLQKDPEQRLGGTTDFAELQAHPFFEDKVNWDDLYDRKVRPPFRPDLRNAKMTKYFEKKTIYEPDVLADLHDDPIVVHPDVPELQRSFNRFSLHEKRENDDVPANDEPLKMV